ncbi:MAG: hypothetical protein RL748_1444 [Pseudomonadota bacterium]|jgi:uncharacterized membrane-anchored protein
MRKTIILITVALVLALANWTIVQREQLLKDGHIVLLELAPVDPRSLMQGDYMALRYALVDKAFPQRKATGRDDGYIVVAVDANQVASFHHFDDGTPLAANQVKMRFRVRHEQVKFATNAWFFEEGSASLYERAKYGEFRVAGNGEMLLSGMRGEDFAPLGKHAGASAKPAQLSDTGG